MSKMVFVDGKGKIIESGNKWGYIYIPPRGIETVGKRIAVKLIK